MNLFERQVWMNRANCLGMTYKMFPQHHKDITYIQEAREICDGCKVREECLEYALEFPPADMHGVWAGLTSRQLAAEQKRRGIKAVRPTLAQMWNEK
jgi:WhiB family redox-sensing transcriptional regulator